MAKEKPKPIPVFIESFTGSGLKFEFIVALYESILEAAYEKYDIEIDWIKIESSLDKIELIISSDGNRKRYMIPLDERGYWRSEEHLKYILNYTGQKMVRDLAIKREATGGKRETDTPGTAA